MPAASPLRVVAVGCGQPKKSMGWFHIQQMLGDPNVHLEAIVEPWYLGKGKGSPGSEEFASFCKELKTAHPKLITCQSVQDLPVLRATGDPPVLAVIATRTADAPGYFKSICERGASHVYLEKPGATSRAELEELLHFAQERGVEAVVGYNKNVSNYMRLGKAELERLGEQGVPVSVSLEHNNPFDERSPELLAFITGACAEGLVHNMSCHELALAITLFGVTCSRVTSITLEPEATEKLKGTDDWKRVAFVIRLDGAEGPSAPLPRRLSEIRISEDRCGGNFSRICINSANGEQEFRLPTAEEAVEIAKEVEKDPEIRQYFLQQSSDYERLRGSFIQHIVDGKKGTPDGVVSLKHGVETLRLADMLAPALKDCFARGEPWTWKPQPLPAEMK